MFRAGLYSGISIGALAVGSPAETMVAPPTISGDAFEGGVLWVDDGLDDPTTTYTRQWVSGPSYPPSTPISGQTGLSTTLGATGGQYVACLVTPANGEAARLSNVVRVHHAVMTAPVLTRTSASGAAPFTYTVAYDNTVTADDIERVQYASDIGFSTILWDAMRGLTEAAFTTPYTPDETVDADPAWDTAPPTFSGTYFVRRKAIALQSFSGAQVESSWSNTISNFVIDTTVRLSPTASWDSPDPGEPDSRFTFSGDFLTFTDQGGGGNFRQHAVQCNFARTGRRTVDLVFTQNCTSNGFGIPLYAIGFDDGTFDWSSDPAVNNKQISQNGYKGFFIRANGDGVELVKGTGTTTTSGPSRNAAGGGINEFLIGDRLRLDYTPGTFTGATPDNNGTCNAYRVRSGVATLAIEVTGLPSMASAKVVAMTNYGGSAQVAFIALVAPAIPSGSQEYQ